MALPHAYANARISVWRFHLGLYISRKNWMIISTVSGAKANAIIYSLVETAKANNLWVRPYLKEVISYMRYLLNANGSERVDVNPILPWSDKMQGRFALSNPLEEESVQVHVYVSAVTCSHLLDSVELPWSELLQLLSNPVQSSPGWIFWNV